MNSFSEATSKGVPLICVPLFGDQLFNIGVVKDKNIGVALKKTEITSGNVAAALRKVLYEDKR